MKSSPHHVVVVVGETAQEHHCGATGEVDSLQCREGFREHALDVGEDVRTRDGVPRGVAAAARGLEVEDSGLEPGVVEAVHADAEELAAVGEAKAAAVVEAVSVEVEADVKENTSANRAEAGAEEHAAVDGAEADAEERGRPRQTLGRRSAQGLV